jgi:hypothetical protein
MLGKENVTVLAARPTTAQLASSSRLGRRDMTVFGA